MSALFMSHHRYSTINPEDIARFGGRRTSLNSISFRTSAEFDDDEGGSDDGDDQTSAQPLTPEEEERAIGEFGELQEPSKFKRQASRRQSTRSRASARKHTKLNRLYRWWKRIYRRYGFNHAIPILLLILYSFVGALIFQAIESPHAEQKRKNILDSIENSRRFATQTIINDLELSNELEVRDKLSKILAQFERDISLPMKEMTMTWDMWSSLFYCGTIYTTVGYGSIYPETTAGWICTIIYAFFGVPLLLAILSDVGQLLCYWMDRTWIAFVDRLPSRNKKENSSRSACNDNDSLNDSSTDDGAPKAGAPVLVALALTFAWLLMVAALFCLWEKKWTYFTAFYFFFISLSTIGLGDITPDEPMLMVLMSGFLIIGLCLVSMTIGVVQERIELFLYRVMIALQKECEQLLSNGEDVDKQELMKKVWDKQPWFVRRFMPAVMGGSNSKRLKDFAGATITDTAVQMGIIPPPAGYRRQLLPMAAGFSPPPLQVNSSRVRYAMDKTREADLSDASANAIQSLLFDSATSMTRPIAPKVATVRPQQRPTSASCGQTCTEFLPGGRAIVRRVHSLSPVDGKREFGSKLRLSPICPIPKMPAICKFVQTDLTGLDLPTNKDTVSTVSLASWNENDPSSLTRLVPFEYVQKIQKETRDTCVQTELTGKEIVIKMETLSNLSLASWCEDEEPFLPASMKPMKTFAADDLQQFREVVQEMTAVSSQNLKIDQMIQTDPDFASRRSEESLSSSDFESAKETGSVLVNSKASQTTPFENVDIETQTAVTNLITVEVQTSLVPRTDAQVQHRPSAVDEEVQTVEWEKLTHHDQQADDVDAAELVPTRASDEREQDDERATKENLDKFTQTDLEISYCDVEIQTTATRTLSLEIQTDAPDVQDAEAQTALRRVSFLSLAVGNDGDDSEEEDTDDEMNADGETEPNIVWSYNAFFSDQRRKKRLDAVPEEEDEFETEEEGGVYLSRIEAPHPDSNIFSELEDDEADEADQADQADGEESESSIEQETTTPMSEGGTTLPAITVSPPSSISGDAVSIASGRSSEKQDSATGCNFGSVVVEIGIQTDSLDCHSVACQTIRSRHQSGSSVITAAIATQTEESLEASSAGAFLQIPSGSAEASIGHRHGGSFRNKLSAWTDRRRGKEKERQTQTRKNAAVQTEGYICEGYRDIIIQTDDSYLRMARRLNALRTMRAKSLKITVAPQLRQRLGRLASGATGATESSGLTKGRHTKS